MADKVQGGDSELRNRKDGKETENEKVEATDDSYEFAAVAPDEDIPELRVEEGQDIDYRVILVFYLLGDLGAFNLMRFFAGFQKTQ